MAATREAPILVRDAVESDHVLAGTLVSPATARGRISLAMLQEGRGRLWVAITEDQGAEQIVGLLLADTQPDAETGELVGYIQELLVHPAYRRRGVAMHLLDAAEQFYFAEMNLGAITLVTTPENEGALRLYRSRGYGMDQVRLRKRRMEG